MSLCQKCANANCNHAAEPGELVVCCGAYKPPMTNADRIRSMSDEDLAEWVVSFVADQFENATAKTHCEAIINKNANSDMLKWLQQPAEEVEHG